ncbi:MAG: hypothetical protein U1F09_03125 [Steroidobacteraceae bacterium]
MTARAVATPSGKETRKAAAITTPSTKLWNASPNRISGAAVPWLFVPSSWKWRHSTSFSSTKNASMPASTVAMTPRAGACSSAAGNMPRKAAPSSVPVA